MASLLRSRQVTSGLARRLVHSYSLPPLPYEYDALAPVISKEIMELHHLKHHQTYVNNLNNLLQSSDKDDLSASIRKQAAIKFNGGGHLNHSIFWTNLAPPNKGGGEAPKSGELLDAIRNAYGDVSELQKIMNAEAAAVQGSGWAWLVYNQPNKKLSIMTTSNQDPVVGAGVVPLLGIDVWEHAYYLDYKNVRPEYLKQIWKVVNWANIEERFDAAKSS